jgi:hypothetical protein
MKVKVSFAPQVLYLRERALYTCLLGDWVDPRADQDALWERNNLLLCQELNADY